MDSKYNATVIGKIMITPDIMVLRVNTDTPRAEFESGQYTVIGLYGHEARSVNSGEEHKESQSDKLIQRAYSIASNRASSNQMEFYISQVKDGQLTPRVFGLEQGDRLYVSERIVGMFKLSDTPKGFDIAMVATGTGVAPYISFLRSHIAENSDINMAVIHGAAHQWDLGYYSELSFLASTFPNFHYFPTLTDADETWQGRKLWIKELLEDEILANEANIATDPEKTHFFLCGNPKMAEGISAWLNEYEYEKHSRKVPGALHVEEF
ncbi:MAG: ferredoxin--NADP reductase [Anaerolineae bacterium]|nr:ferredoxin--NADP reductase [Anaerolineae bacterium]MBT7075693.1 ferredoxin--NADP reductase [Anaerolineae bacterium]